MLQQQRIRQSRCRIRPRRVGEALRLDVAEAPLHYPCQCCNQLRIRRRRIGDVLRVELANAAANGASDCALLRIEVAEAGSTILAMLERLQPRAPEIDIYRLCGPEYPDEERRLLAPQPLKPA